MSTAFFSWRSAFQKSNLSPTTKLVLFCISTYMNDHGEGAFPSIETIMVDSSLSNRAVITHIKKAQEFGFLKVSQHGFKGRNWKRNEYHISIPEAMNEVHDDSDKAVNLTTQGGEPHAQGSEPNDIGVVNEVHSITPLNSPSNSPSNSGRVELEYMFLDWWQHYPKKVSENKARKEFAKALDIVAIEELTEKTKAYAASVAGEPQKYITAPHNWLDGHCWKDALPEKEFDPIEYLRKTEQENENI